MNIRNTQFNSRTKIRASKRNFKERRVLAKQNQVYHFFRLILSGCKYRSGSVITICGSLGSDLQQKIENRDRLTAQWRWTMVVIAAQEKGNSTPWRHFRRSTLVVNVISAKKLQHEAYPGSEAMHLRKFCQAGLILPEKSNVKVACIKLKGGPHFSLHHEIRLFPISRSVNRQFIARLQ